MIAIARIVKAVGVHGALKLEPLTHSLDRFERVREVKVGMNDEHATPRAVEAWRIANGAVQVHLEGVRTPEEAATLRGHYLYVEDTEVAPPPEGEFFVHDIIGLKVETTDGTMVGTIRDVLDFPANDVWVVERGTKEVMIPAIKEIVREVNVKQKRVVIHPLEGLLDDAD